MNSSATRVFFWKTLQRQIEFALAQVEGEQQESICQPGGFLQAKTRAIRAQ